MCWMSLRAGDGAVADVMADVADHEKMNGHSWGVAFVRDGELTVEKGVGHIPAATIDRLEAAGDGADVALAHTRFATCGVVCPANAHPYPIYDADDNMVAALAHNGTWLESPAERDSFHTDSYYMARDLEERYQADPDASFESHVAATGKHTGETFIVTHRDGVGYVYAGRYTITEGEQFVPDDPEPDDVDPYDAPTLREALARRWEKGTPRDDCYGDTAADGGRGTATVARSSGGKTLEPGTVTRIEAHPDDEAPTND